MKTQFELGPKQTQWLAALRSGDFKQGKGVLRSHDNEYCCLGVACQILGREWRDAGDEYQCEGHGDVVPDSVVDAIALRSSNGTHRDDILSAALANLNDDGMSFAQIANVLEADPSAYFTGAA